MLRLNNDLVIRLLGVKNKNSVHEEAIAFLEEKVKGQRVFMKFDNQKYDEHNNLLCYLYLKNKTFINAHLIKKGLAEVDTTVDFKYKNKFLSIGEK